MDQIQHESLTSLNGDFARIQTKVAPQNPYDNIKRNTDTEVNKSLDHIMQPTVNSKKTNHSDYNVDKREKELKSILKK
jgi:hypothetical protein